jgi:hypothetical protein
VVVHPQQEVYILNIPDVILAALPGTLVAILGVFVQLRRERNLPDIDRSNAALTTTQMDKLRAEIARDLMLEVRAENKELKVRVDDLEFALDKERGERRTERNNFQAELETERRARYELELRFQKLDREHAEYKVGIGLLLGQLVDAQLQPTWKPKDTGPMGKLPEVNK